MTTAIATGYSYEYQNIIRDVDIVFDQLRQSYPTLLAFIKTGANARATKHEWLEDSLTATATNIGSFDTDGDGTGINVGSTAGMRAGSILRFTSVLDASKTEQVQITTVDSATDLTVVRDYAGTTGVTLVVGDKVFLVSSPINEKTDASAGVGQEPGIAYNYTQIFERVADIAATAEAIGIYGLENALDYQVRVKMVEIMREMNAQLIHGNRLVRSESVQGTAGGLLSYLTGGNVDTTGGVISSTILNNMLEAIFNDGGFSNNYAIVCAENQARKISALNTSGSNPMITKAQNDQNLGGYISQFTGDLPVMDGFMAKIIVEPNMLKDQIAIVDLNNVELNWLNNRNLKDSDATLPGGDYFRRRIIGEATFTVKNGAKAHALATDLTV